LNDPCYVFVVVSHQAGEPKTARDTWAAFLKAYVMSAKHICPRAQHIIAIGINKNAEMETYNAENLAYVDARGWSKKEQGYVQQLMHKTSLLKNLRTFGTINLEYPPKSSDQPIRVPMKEATLVMKGKDRNKPCPCGSGRKYKNCCGGW
jgi:SEC-C motif